MADTGRALVAALTLSLALVHTASQPTCFSPTDDEWWKAGEARCEPSLAHVMRLLVLVTPSPTCVLGLHVCTSHHAAACGDDVLFPPDSALVHVLVQ